MSIDNLIVAQRDEGIPVLVRLGGSALLTHPKSLHWGGLRSRPCRRPCLSKIVVEISLLSYNKSMIFF